MKKIITLITLLITSQWASAEITTDQVLATISKMSIAANQRNIAEMVATVPADGVKIENTATGQTTVLDRAGMRKHIQAYFGTMHAETYTYGARLCSVDRQTPEFITVTVEVYEAFRLIEPDELRTTRYSETVVFALEDGAVVVKFAKMGATTSQKP